MKRALLALFLIPQVLFAGADPRGILELEGASYSDATGITASRWRGGFNSNSEALASGDKLFFIKGYGYNGSALTTNAPASIEFDASQAWTTTANGTKVIIKTTPNGSVTPATVATFDHDGSLTITGTFAPTGASTLSSATVTNQLVWGATTAKSTMTPTAIYLDDGLTFNTKGKMSGIYNEAASAADGTNYMTYLTSVTVSAASAAEVTSLRGRYNWYVGDNANFIANGIEGVAASYGPDESMTGRGASLRTYIAPGGTMRTSIGADISARASSNGDTAIVAESGTAFVGARIWMAPYFTNTSTANINNYHGLWIYNEHASIQVDNGITISDAGGGFTNDITLQSGETIRNSTDGIIDISGGLSVNGGPFTPYSRTEAQLLVSTPTAVGQVFFDSTNVQLILTTGTATCKDYSEVNDATAYPTGW